MSSSRRPQPQRDQVTDRRDRADADAVRGSQADSIGLLVTGSSTAAVRAVWRHAWLDRAAPVEDGAPGVSGPRLAGAAR
ncbi:MAG TPA: hypothetical protein VHJ18_00935 [Streptosporangiaceae bacterium]|nr:hypothetical protein [Streptosporangiaceae bacterium]